MFVGTTGLMTIQCVPLKELFETEFTVVNKGFGEMFRLDMVLNVVFGLVRKGSTDRADPRV